MSSGINLALELTTTVGNVSAFCFQVACNGKGLLERTIQVFIRLIQRQGFSIKSIETFS